MNRAERKRMNRNKPTPKNWIEHPSPKQKGVGSGWFAELDKTYRRNDNSFVVMTRNVNTEWGVITHATITTQDGRDVTWSEKQKIKNELFGEESQAIEVFPKESQLVDDANMYHLWILDNDFVIPFTLKE